MDARAGSLWHKRAGASNSSDLTLTSRWTTLEICRDSFRDKYMAQLQLMYTEKLAKTGQMQGLVVEDNGEEEDQDRQQRDAIKAEQEKHFANKMLAKKKQDARYGPSYERIIVLDSDRYNMGQEVDFLEGCRGKAVDSEEKMRQTYQRTVEETDQIKGGIQKIEIN